MNDKRATCELEALTTCGGIPEEVTVPVGGRFLLVTDAHEKVWMGKITKDYWGSHMYPYRSVIGKLLHN